MAASDCVRQHCYFLDDFLRSHDSWIIAVEESIKHHPGLKNEDKTDLPQKSTSSNGQLRLAPKPCHSP